jgi:hypothetical protein
MLLSQHLATVTEENRESSAGIVGVPAEIRTGHRLRHGSEALPPQPLCSVGGYNILWHIDQLLGNDSETNNETTAVAWQRPARQWTGWEAVFSARTAPMVAHATMDTAKEERCFLYGPFLNVMRRTISGASSVNECCARGS